MNDPADGNDRIHIEQIELHARVGVTEEERAQAQRLVLSLTIWPQRRFNELQDDVANSVDYAAVATAARDFVATKSTRLIETLSEQLVSHLLKSFSIAKIQLELRKFVLPDCAHVAVILTRTIAVNSNAKR